MSGFAQAKILIKPPCNNMLMYHFHPLSSHTVRPTTTLTSIPLDQKLSNPCLGGEPHLKDWPNALVSNLSNAFARTGSANCARLQRAASSCSLSISFNSANDGLGDRRNSSAQDVLPPGVEGDGGTSSMGVSTPTDIFNDDQTPGAAQRSRECCEQDGSVARQRSYIPGLAINELTPTKRGTCFQFGAAL